MRARFIVIYTLITDSFWFLPALMALLSAAAAIGMVWADAVLGEDWVSDVSWIWSGSAEGARSVLSVIAGSIMTVVSIVYSLTITSLAQTSSHFGPRVLRNFTSDRGNQVVLGTFIATFVYCLIVLRTVNAEPGSRFVPFLSVNLGFVLALASLGVLIYFIHHISQSIQAENLISDVGVAFQDAVPQLFPKSMGEARGDTVLPNPTAWDSAHTVKSATNGYVLGIDTERLMELADEHDLLLKLEKRPGDFVTCASALLYALPVQRASVTVSEELAKCYSWGNHRSPHQDVLYSIQQLVEIAAHALSPGINEPFTALTCIDWLGASLRSAAAADMPSPHRHGEDGRLRVISPTMSFDEIVHASFDQIRTYGCANVMVVRHLLSTIAELAPHLRRAGDCDSLKAYVELIGTDANRQLGNADDRARVEQTRLQAAARLTAMRARIG